MDSVKQIGFGVVNYILSTVQNSDSSLTYDLAPGLEIASDNVFLLLVFDT